MKKHISVYAVALTLVACESSPSGEQANLADKQGNEKEMLSEDTLLSGAVPSTEKANANAIIKKLSSEGYAALAQDAAIDSSAGTIDYKPKTRTDIEYVLVGDSLLINGGFETHRLKPNSWKVFDRVDGWIKKSGAGLEIQNSVAGKAFEGTAKLELDSHGANSNSAAVQEVATTAGAKYRLTFAYSPRPNNEMNSNKVEAMWNGLSLVSLAKSGKGLSGTDWSVYSYDVEGADGESQVEFKALGRMDTLGGYIDGVTLHKMIPTYEVAVDPADVMPIVVDNTDAELIGEWQESTAISGYNGKNYVHNQDKDGQSKSAAFRFAIPYSGYWKVMARWTQHENRATNALYQIHHADGVDSATVNQRIRGGQWNDMGAFRFDGSMADAKVVLTASEGSDGHVIADAIQLVYQGTQAPSYAQESPITLDNSDSYYVKIFGQWLNSSVVKQYEGSDYLHDNDQDHVAASGESRPDYKRVVYTPDFAKGGKYRVSIRWTAHSNRATNARFMVSHADGQDSFSGNQKLGGGLYHELGVYTFKAGRNVNNGSVVVLRPADANGHVIADAVRFELINE